MNYFKGHLKKQSKYRKTWKDRYFSIEDGIITYKKDENDPTSKEIDTVGGKVSIIENFPFRILLTLPNSKQDVVLDASSEENVHSKLFLFLV